MRSVTVHSGHIQDEASEKLFVIIITNKPTIFIFDRGHMADAVSIEFVRWQLKTI